SLDKPSPVKILMRDGVALENPETLTNTAAISAANRLRMEAPRSEQLMWDSLKGLGFEHSVPMYGYVMDFYHPSLRICVEIDGSVHRTRKAQDRRRDEALRRRGIETYRFWARHVYQEQERIVGHIRNIVELKSPIQLP